MALRYYLVPAVNTGKYWGPKYIDGKWYTGGLDCWWEGMKLGREPTYMIIADVTGPQHTSISSNSDVISFPVDIDSKVGSGALDKVSSALESLNIPGNWMTTEDTYRGILRKVAQFSQFLQRLSGVGADQVFRGRTLATQWSSIPAPMQANVQKAIVSMGMGTLSVGGATTIRQILTDFADRLGSNPIYLGGVSL